jgi:hypothetical protein
MIIIIIIIIITITITIKIPNPYCPSMDDWQSKNYRVNFIDLP